MGKNNWFKTFVLTFDKRKFDRVFIEKLTDLEKYNLANTDNNCSVYTSE